MGDLDARSNNPHKVALRTEGVDRNVYAIPIKALPQVALRTEGVDRNASINDGKPYVDVALRTEGVDRNNQNTGKDGQRHAVALRTEGLGRNFIPIV